MAGTGKNKQSTTKIVSVTLRFEFRSVQGRQDHVRIAFECKHLLVFTDHTHEGMHPCSARINKKEARQARTCTGQPRAVQRGV